MIDWKNLDKQIQVGYRAEINADTLVVPMLRKVLTSGEGCITRVTGSGYSDEIASLLDKKCQELKGRRIYEICAPSENSVQSFVYLWEDAILDFEFQKSTGYTTFNLLSSNDELTIFCKEITNELKPKPKQGYVFAITRSPSGGLQMTRIGFAGMPLERGNYADNVIKDYDYIMDDLKSKNPTGRVVVLEGNAGTGKTSLIKGLLMDAPKAMYVVVPPDMVSSIGGPDLIPLLIRTRDEYGKKGPTVFILEDADNCLARRGPDNMSSISSILNLGDGILGSLFDIRIVCTTNAKTGDLDPAIVRDMRLSKRISINELPYEQANKIFKRIMKNEEMNLPIPEEEERGGMRPRNKKEKFSLAEVYKSARNSGWVPEQKKEEEPAVSNKMFNDDISEVFLRG